MDRRERVNDPEEVLRMLFDSRQAGLWTAMPGVLNNVSNVAGKMTVDVQPTLMVRVRAPDGALSFVKLPLLLDCPVQFFSGGGFTLTVPLAAGDEGLVVFASRCIDGWWQQGGAQIPPEIRMHDLSDGFFLPGIRSLPRVLPGISTTTTQLRSDDGATFVEVAGGGVVNVAAPTQINLNSPVVFVAGIINVNNENSVATPCTINGAITASGEITSTHSGTHTLTQHVHGGVQAGGSNTATPTG